MTSNTDGFERIVHRVDGVETVTYAIGQGEPLVYLHASDETAEQADWQWARDLAQSYRIFLPQHPAFGVADGSVFTSARDYAAHYELLFPALELDSFTVVGEGTGAAIAAAFAAGNPDDVTRLLLIAPEEMGEDAKKRIPRPVPDLTAPTLMLVAVVESDVPKDVAKAWKKSETAELRLFAPDEALSLAKHAAVQSALADFMQA